MICVGGDFSPALVFVIVLEGDCPPPFCIRSYDARDDYGG